jgi:hypothetical protein
MREGITGMGRAKPHSATKWRDGTFMIARSAQMRTRRDDPKGRLLPIDAEIAKKFSEKIRL